MVEAFAPLLQKSKSVPRIVNVTSGGGSIARRLDPTVQTHRIGMWGIAYCASKAAMNLFTVAQSVVYGEQGFKVFAFSPGFVVSNLGPHNSAESSPQQTSEGAAPIVKTLNVERDEEHAHFLTATGQYPWQLQETVGIGGVSAWYCDASSLRVGRVGHNTTACRLVNAIALEPFSSTWR